MKKLTAGKRTSTANGLIKAYVLSRRESKMCQRVIHGLMMIALVIGLIGLSPAPMAYAASNGQQIMIQVNNGNFPAFHHFKYIVVKGTNQNGQQASYYTGDGIFTQNPYQINGWWWKGSAGAWGTVYRADGTSSFFTCSFNVPTNQTSNWTKLTLTPYRGSVGGISYSCSSSPG